MSPLSSSVSAYTAGDPLRRQKLKGGKEQIELRVAGVSSKVELTEIGSCSARKQETSLVILSRLGAASAMGSKRCTLYSSVADLHQHYY